MHRRTYHVPIWVRLLLALLALLAVGLLVGTGWGFVSLYSEPATDGTAGLAFIALLLVAWFAASVSLLVMMLFWFARIGASIWVPAVMLALVSALPSVVWWSLSYDEYRWLPLALLLGIGPVALAVPFGVAVVDDADASTREDHELVVDAHGD